MGYYHPEINESGSYVSAVSVQSSGPAETNSGLISFDLIAASLVSPVLAISISLS